MIYVIDNKNFKKEVAFLRDNIKTYKRTDENHQVIISVKKTLVGKENQFGKVEVLYDFKN